MLGLEGANGVWGSQLGSTGIWSCRGKLPCPHVLGAAAARRAGKGQGLQGEAQAGGVQDFEGIWAAERPDADTGPQRAKVKRTEALLFFSALALVGLAGVGSVPRGPVG